MTEGMTDLIGTNSLFNPITFISFIRINLELLSKERKSRVLQVLTAAITFSFHLVAPDQGFQDS